MNEKENLYVNATRFQTRALTVVADAEAIAKINSDDALTVANDFLLGIRAITKEISDTFDPHIKKAHESHQNLLAEKRRFIDMYARPESIVRRAVADYLVEKERLRKEAQAERDRLEAERIRQQQKAQAEATKAVDRGDEVKALNILAKSSIKDQVLMEARPMVPSKPATEGISARVIWKYEITNPDLLPQEFLLKPLPNLAAISRQVSFLKGDCKIPGVRVFSENILAVRQG